MAYEGLPDEGEIDTITLPPAGWTTPADLPEPAQPTGRIDVSPETLVFPQDSPPYRAVSEFPADKTGQEKRIAERVVARLNASSYTFRIVDADRERPDVLLQRTQNRAIIGLELTWVCDRAHVNLRAHMQKYAQRIRESMGGIVHGLGGIEITITPLRFGVNLPPTGTPESSTVVESISSQLLRDIGFSSINALPGAQYTSEIVVGNSISFRAVARRFRSDVFGTRPVVHFGEEYATTRDRQRRLLYDAIKEKSVRYAQDPYGEALDELWLLGWDSYAYLLGSDVALAADAARTSPFTQVWTCFLAGQADADVVERVFSS